MLPCFEYQGATCFTTCNWHNTPMKYGLLFTILVLQRKLRPRETG